MAIINRKFDEEDRKKLSEEELKQAGGGYIYHDEGGDAWYVIDDNNGDILATRFQKDSIINDAAKLGQSTRELSRTEWMRLRNGKSI